VTGPLPITVQPQGNRLWDFLQTAGQQFARVADARFPVGDIPLPGGFKLNDALVPFTNSRSDDTTLLPDSLTLNELGKSLEALSPANVVRQHRDAISGVDSQTGEPVEGFARLMGLFPAAGAEGGGLMAPAVSRGSTTVGTYAGVKSATADIKALTRAKELELGGGNAGPAGEIRKQTGWFKDAAGDWKYEISDHDSAIKLAEPNAKQVYTGPYDPDEPPRWLSETKVADALEHPDLLAAYPWLGDVQLFKDSRMGHADSAQFEGGYGNPPSEWGIRTGGDPQKRGFHHGTLLHEIQHAVQEFENHARGANPRQFTSQVDNDLVQRLLNEANDYSGAEFLRRYQGDAQLYEQIHGWPPSPEAVRLSKLPREETEGMSAHLLRQVEKHKRENDPYGQYMRTLGEVEARDTEARMNLDPQERRLSTPYASQGIPSSQYIIAKAQDDLPPQSAGLDMSPEARAARAALQGYSLDAYHGTKADFTEFQHGGPGKPNPDGFVHVGDQDAANGIIMRDWNRQYWEREARESPHEWRRAEAQRELESTYNGAHIMPLKVKANNPLDMPDLGRWDSYSNFMSNAAKEKGWGQDYEPKGWTPTPEVWADFRALVDRVRKLDWQEQKTAWAEGFTEILTRHGYDSVRYPNEIEGAGGFSYMLLDPSQARSRFAEFHPDKVNDANILSGRHGIPVPRANEPPPDADPERRVPMTPALASFLAMGGT
jgi:hypothetical protein